MKLIITFIMSLFIATTLSANCGKCDMKGMQKEQTSGKYCKMHKKENCTMEKCAKKGMKKEGSCGAGKCGAGMMKKDEMSGNAGNKMKGSCGAGKCGQSMMKKEGSCGAGKCGKGMMKKSNCNMKAKCDKPNCKMKKMDSKPNCDCKNGGECKCKAAGKECKCSLTPAKKEVKNCGCGMTIESCKKMMPSCEYRDAKEAKK